LKFSSLYISTLKRPLKIILLLILMKMFLILILI